MVTHEIYVQQGVERNVLSVAPLSVLPLVGFTQGLTQYFHSVISVCLFSRQSEGRYTHWHMHGTYTLKPFRPWATEPLLESCTERKTFGNAMGAGFFLGKYSASSLLFVFFRSGYMHAAP
jgi:hypothetical protein